MKFVECEQAFVKCESSKPCSIVTEIQIHLIEEHLNMIIVRNIWLPRVKHE